MNIYSCIVLLDLGGIPQKSSNSWSLPGSVATSGSICSYTASHGCSQPLPGNSLSSVMPQHPSAHYGDRRCSSTAISTSTTLRQGSALQPSPATLTAPSCPPRLPAHAYWTGSRSLSGNSEGRLLPKGQASGGTPQPTGQGQCLSHHPGAGQAGQSQGLQPDPTESPDHQPDLWRQGKPEVKLGSQPMGQGQAWWG